MPTGHSPVKAPNLPVKTQTSYLFSMIVGLKYQQYLPADFYDIWSFHASPFGFKSHFCTSFLKYFSKGLYTDSANLFKSNNLILFHIVT
jgi:hypothetical protein